MNEPLEIRADFVEAREVLQRLARAGASAAAPPSGNGAPSSMATGQAAAAVPSTWAEQTLRRLLESLPDALVVIDARGNIVLVNGKTEELFGYSRAEMLGQAVELLIPERYRAAHVGQRANYFAAPRVRPMGAGLNLQGRHKSGAEFPVEISLSPLQTEHGPLFTAVVRDVTLRKREEAKFRTLVENIPAVTFIAPLDDSAPEFYVSPQIEQMLGFSQKEWLEDPVLWHRQLHPEDRERWNVQFAPTCAEGTAFRSIYRFIAKDGRVVWVHGSAQMVRGGEGQPVFLQGVAFDVTAIKEAEEAERARARLTALQARINASVTRGDALPVMLRRCVEALVEHLGIPLACIWTLDESQESLRLQASAGAVSAPIASIGIGSGIPRTDDEVADLIAGHLARVMEQSRLTSALSQPLRMEDRLIGVAALCAPGALPHDVPPLLRQICDEIVLGVGRKHAEEALYRLNVELERRVCERTEELARSTTELREKSEELEQFTYVASHDLREPLRTLVNYPQRLLKHYGDTFNPEAREWIERVTNGADRMRRLIDSLSYYARVLRRDRSFAMVETAVVIEEARSNLQAAIEECGADLRVGEMPAVRGNQQQLMLLFQNLIGNAVKFRSSKRPVRVEVACERRGDDWLFRVRDNGIGIEAKFLERIFGLGERLHSASRYTGSGFGLTICAKIVTGHGGRIWVESEFGEGSTFFFTLGVIDD